MDKAVVKRLVGFGAGGAVLFLLLPLLIRMIPAEETSAMTMMVLMMLINPMFLAFVGWQSNYIPKYGIYVPLLVVGMYFLSEIFYFGQATWTMEMNYIEMGYVAYFIKKLLLKRQAREEAQNKKSFPKGVGRR